MENKPISKTYCLPKEIIDFIEEKAKKENRNPSNYIANFFQNLKKYESET